MCRFKSCSWLGRDSRWWGSLTMVMAENKAIRLSPIDHTTKATHHHHVLQKKKKPFQRKYINFWNYFLKLFLNISTGFGYFILTAYQFNSQSMGWPDKHRSSHWRCSVKKGVLKNFTNFIGKHLWSLFLVMLQAWLAATLLKRDSSTSVFL